jgi:hypothetical protein
MRGDRPRRRAEGPRVTTFQNVNVLLRTAVLLGLVALGGWWTLMLRNKLVENRRELEQRTAELADMKVELDRRDGKIAELGEELAEKAQAIETLEVELAEKEKEIQTLSFALQLLKVDRRVAKVEVLAQGASEQEPERVRTTLRFTELDPGGEPLGPGREVTIEGRTIYVESLVIKFEDAYVERGDPLRGASLCLFRRIFGENQSPGEGTLLDASGELPAAYAGDTTPSPLHRSLWERFWDYANDPELARELGVRAIHGEAPFIEARPGKTYRLQLRASDGLTLLAE